MREAVRTHVLVPREVLDAIDRLVGQRRRSQFLTEAAREKLERMDEERRRAERAAMARALVGSLAGAGRSIPEWDTPESARERVRTGRRARDERHEAAWDKP